MKLNSAYKACSYNCLQFSKKIAPILYKKFVLSNDWNAIEKGFPRSVVFTV